MNDFEVHIAGLNGYLHSLRRFRGVGFFYSARSYPMVEDIDRFLMETISGWGECGEFQYLGRSKIEFQDLVDRLVGIIFSGALNLENVSSDSSKDNIRKLVIDDINEYYGLASTSLNPNGVFHPLIKGPVFEIKVESKGCVEFFSYLVQIENYFVLTNFSRRKRAV